MDKNEASKRKELWILKDAVEDNVPDILMHEPTRHTASDFIHVIEYSYVRNIENKLNTYISAVDKFNNLWLEHGCTIDTKQCPLCQIHEMIHDYLDKALSGETKE